MRNVEWKARLLYRERAERICRELGAREVAILEQRDTYFRVARGRLKRRECAGRPTEWIEYFRPDQRDARSSDHALYTSREAVERFDLDALEALCSAFKPALGEPLALSYSDLMLERS